MDTLIAQVLRQVPEATQEDALSALRRHNNDIQNAIFDLLDLSAIPTKPSYPTTSEDPERAEWRKRREICDDMERNMYAAAKSASVASASASASKTT